MPETHSCTQEERIERIEGAVEALAKQLPDILSELRMLKDKMDNVLRKQDDHHSVLYGEQGKSGLIAWSERTGETLTELRLALKGEGKEPGLIAVIGDLVRHMNELEDTKKWLIRLVIGYVVSAVLAGIMILK